MKRKSLVEDIIETAFKNPTFGIVIGIFFVVLGLFLMGKQAPPTAKPSEVMLLPTMHLIGKVSLFFSALILIVTGIGYAVYSQKRKQQTAFFGTRRTLDDLKNLSWKEFEEYIGSMFEKMGYTVEVTGGLKDGGIDLIIRKDGKTSLVQCKNYRVSKVSLSMVRDFYGAMNANLNFEAGYFITTGIFTLDAKQFAKDKPIELIDGAKLMDYVLTSSAKGIQQERPFKKESAKTPPDCPKCGSNMVLRTAKRGDNAGSQFWGCSTYPKCNGTKSI